jgi:hypothetical protein
VLESVFKGGNQPLILGEVVGLVAEIFAQSCDLASRFVLNNYAVTGWAGIPARAAIAVGDQVVFGRILTSFKELSGTGAAGENHDLSLQRERAIPAAGPLKANTFEPRSTLGR